MAKMGRPSTYKPEHCETVIEIGEKGGWLSEMAEACNVHRSTMDKWAEKHPDFKEALTRAKQKAQAWFEIQGREGLTKERFNSSLWAKQVSNRFRDDYTEAGQQLSIGGINVQILTLQPDGEPLKDVTPDMQTGKQGEQVIEKQGE